jgi:aminomethyltransferase
MTPIAEYEALIAAAAAWAPTAVGQFEVSGIDAHAFVNRVTTVDISRVPPGRFAHALFLRDDASILGRVTVYRIGDLVMLLVDEPSREAIWRRLLALKRGNVRLRDISAEVAVVVVRGPTALSRVTTLLAPTPIRAGDLVVAEFAAAQVFAARTTSDGPDGIDIYCRRRDIDPVRQSLQALAIPFVSDATWELARLEWGVARVGVEIDAADTPVEAALEGLVAADKGASYPGEVAFLSRRRTGPLKRLVGFAAPGREVPDVGAPLAVNGRVVDRVRSAGLSPRFGVIGMTAVPVGADQEGTAVTIAAPAGELHGRVVRPPFRLAGGAEAAAPRGSVG